ncbi:MAG: DUF6285 domain-containing protein [Pseudomonadota bacterium]|nr:DUF6285 domain-containing protein [Pseudomonadota bacterium]
MRDEYTEESYMERKYETLMIINAINIAHRQLALEKKIIYNTIIRLCDILGLDQNGKAIPNISYDEAINILCRGIREGKFDPEMPNSEKVLHILTQIVSLQLDIYSPKYKK